MMNRAFFNRVVPHPRRHRDDHRPAAMAFGLVLLVLTSGCRLFHRQDERESGRNPSQSHSSSTPAPKAHRSSNGPRIRGVVCLYDLKPWISVDAAGDRDPEGIQYRIFLNDGSPKGVACDGTLHIELYQFGRDQDGAQTRTLASDWHYPTSQFQKVSARLMGVGYHVQLFWAKKDIAGTEVEFVTQFEDKDGNTTRGATKRLRVPKYSS